MAEVLVCVQPALGHVNPTLPAVRGLVAAGHRVRVLTGRRYGHRFEATGATWLPLPDEADFDATDLDASLPGRRGLRGIALARYDLSSFVRAMPAQAAAVEAALSAEPAPVILCDPLFLGCVPMLTRRPPGARPAVLQLGFLPLLLPGADTTPRAATRMARLTAAARARGTAVVARRIFAPIQRLAARTVAAAGGSRLDVPFMAWGDLADGVLQMTCPGFEYPRPRGARPSTSSVRSRATAPRSARARRYPPGGATSKTSPRPGRSCTSRRARSPPIPPN